MITDPSGSFRTRMVSSLPLARSGGSPIGMVGSLVATFAGQQMHFYEPGQPAGFIGSVVGAIVVLWIYGMVTKKSGSGTPST